MRHLRLSTVATLLVASAVLPVLAAAPAYAAGSSPSTVQPAAVWTLVRTFTDQTACLYAAPTLAAGRAYQCTPSPRVPSAYDLYVWS